MARPYRAAIDGGGTAARRLAESEARLRAILDAAVDGILTINEEGLIETANPAAERIFGYEPGELVGRPVGSLMPAPYAALHREYLQRYLQTGTPHLLGMLREVQGRRRDGTVFPMELVVREVRAPGRRLFTGFVRDVSRRKAIEEALRLERDFVRRLLETARTLILVLDTEGRIQRVNRYVEDFTGRHREELEGRDFFTTLLPPEEREALIRALDEEPPGGVVTPMHTHTGACRLVEWHEAPLRNDAGELTGILLMGEDVTERREAEEALRRAHQELERRVRERTAELQKANQELREFAYIVSHDLKAPLRAINTLVDWIERDHTEVLSPEGKENLQLLKGRVRRMNRLIEGVLRYSRVGRIEPFLEPVPTGRVVGDVVAALTPPPGIRIHVAPDLPTIVYDRTHLEQVFQNLIQNAVQHMGKKEGEVHVGAEDRGEVWEFCVRDTGVGIGPQHHERIFKIFQSLKPKDQSESTGVGLAITKKIVETHGGRIWVESAPGEGATFRFTVPKARSAS